MNELIKDFAVQAGARLCGGYITDPATGNKKWSEEGGLDTAVIDVEKFAKLITKLIIDEISHEIVKP